MIAIIMFVTFVICLVAGVYVGTAMGISSIVALLLQGYNIFSVVPYNYYSAISKYLLLAIPFFIFAGNIMEKSGISEKLINLAQAMVGHVRGGLALVCVAVCCFFAAISGSGPATVAALGGITIPAMYKAGHSKADATALIATAGGIGIIIPPSISFVIYCSIANVSVGAQFMAGLLPGLLVGGALVLASLWVSRRGNLQTLPKASANERWNAFKDAVWALLMPVIILGGIYGGIFTPTEAAAVAVVYGLIVGVFIYRSVRLKELLAIVIDSGKQTGAIMWTLGNAALMSWVLAVSGINSAISSLISVVSNGNLIVFLLITNIIILIAGCFIDGNSIMYIFVPILLPVALELGYNPIALGVLIVINCALGMVTPPVGCDLYVACGVSGSPVKEVARAVVPYVLAGSIVLLLITFVPEISLFLPSLLT